MTDGIDLEQEIQSSSSLTTGFSGANEISIGDLRSELSPFQISIFIFALFSLFNSSSQRPMRLIELLSASS